MIDNEKWLDVAKRLYNASQARKELEKAEKELSDELKEMGKHEMYSFGGMRYYYEVRTGNVNYKDIPALQGIDLELYRGAPSKIWKLSIDAIL